MKSLSKLPRAVVIGGAGGLLIILILAGTVLGMIANGSHAASTSDLETLSVGLQTYHDAIFTDLCNYPDFKPQKGDGYSQDYNLATSDQCYNFFVVDLRNSHQQLASYLNQNLVKVDGNDEVYAWEEIELQKVEQENSDLVSQLGQNSPYAVVNKPAASLATGTASHDNDNTNNPLSSSQQKTLDKAFTNVFINSSPSGPNSGGYTNKRQDLATSLQTYHDDIYSDFCNAVVKQNTTVNNGQKDPCYTIVVDIRKNNSMTLSTYKDNNGNTLNTNNAVTNWEQSEFQTLETAHPELKNAKDASDPTKLDAAFTQVYIGSGQASNKQGPGANSQSEDSLIAAMEPDHDALYSDICNYLKAKNINQGQQDPCYTVVDDINNNYTTLANYIHGKDNSIAVSDVQTWEGNEYQVLADNTQSHFYKVKDKYTQPDANTLDDILTKIYIGPSPTNNTSTSHNSPGTNTGNPSESDLYNAMEKDHDAIYTDICHYIEAQASSLAANDGDCYNKVAQQLNGQTLSDFISSNSSVSADDVKTFEKNELYEEFTNSSTFKNTFSTLPTPDPDTLDKAMSAVYVASNDSYNS